MNWRKNGVPFAAFVTICVQMMPSPSVTTSLYSQIHLDCHRVDLPIKSCWSSRYIIFRCKVFTRVSVWRDHVKSEASRDREIVWRMSQRTAQTRHFLACCVTVAATTSFAWLSIPTASCGSLTTNTRTWVANTRSLFFVLVATKLGHVDIATLVNLPKFSHSRERVVFDKTGLSSYCRGVCQAHTQRGKPVFSLVNVFFYIQGTTTLLNIVYLSG